MTITNRDINGKVISDLSNAVVPADIEQDIFLILNPTLTIERSETA